MVNVRFKVARSRARIASVLVGLAIGTLVGAGVQRLTPPSGSAVAPAPGRATAVFVSLDNATVGPGGTLRGQVVLDLDDGVRSVRGVSADVVALGPNPQPTLAQLVLTADPAKPTYALAWNGVGSDGKLVPEGEYELFVRALLERASTDHRPPFATAFVRVSIK